MTDKPTTARLGLAMFTAECIERAKFSDAPMWLVRRLDLPEGWQVMIERVDWYRPTLHFQNGDRKHAFRFTIDHFLRFAEGDDSILQHVAARLGVGTKTDLEAWG